MGLAEGDGAAVSGGVGSWSKACTAKGRMRFAGVAEHSTSAGAANRPLIRSGYSRRGLGVAAFARLRRANRHQLAAGREIV